MPADLLTGLLTLAFVGAWTPGPNNALVASSGARFGFLATLPHVMGIAIGFPLMMFLVGMFLGGLFQQSELLREIVRWGGAAILLWMAWKLATSGAIGSSKGHPRPFTIV